MDTNTRYRLAKDRMAELQAEGAAHRLAASRTAPDGRVGEKGRKASRRIGSSGALLQLPMRIIAAALSATRSGAAQGK
jgi:hypothetical protein